MGKIITTAFTLGETLTQEQLDYFNKNGVIRFKNFISRDTVNTIISEINRIEKEWLAEGRTKVNGTLLKFGIDEFGNKIIQRPCFLSLFSPFLHELLQDKRFDALKPMLYPYEGRIGEDEKDGLVLNHYVRVEGGVFSKMGWHTDCPRDLFLGEKIMPMLNVGIHLDDVPFENGGLRVLPGTHKKGVFNLMFGKRYYSNNDDKNEVGFNIEAGDLTVHEGRVWHRAKQSPYTGAASRRRVLYVPMITGKYAPKNEKSKTALYHYFR
ncbi:MAG: phytanoyl-CoA dioxygenase [Sphingobacteriales bacterium]|nr:MAG: phytanoyl-CoA dioxygenase [Sphingobacteriales bacterium]